MDKRTIVAFALSFLVLIFWSLFFGPKSEQPKEPRTKERVVQEKPAPAQQKAPTRQETHIQEKAPVEVSAPQASQEKEEEVTVETPLYRAVFSNVGPVLKSFRLKKYHLTTAPGSPMVELAHGNVNLVNVQFVPAKKTGESPLTFKPSETALVLDSRSSPRQLTFTAASPEGVSIRYSLVIDPKRYPIELSVSYSNHSGKPLEGNIKARIADLPPKVKTSYYAFIGLSLLLDNELKELDEKTLKKEEKTFSGPIQWLSYQEDYFMVAAIPENTAKGRFVGRSLPTDLLEATWVGPDVTLVPGGEMSSRFTLFLGPRDLTVLKETGHNLDKAINFGWTDIIAKPLLYALRFFEGYVHNYGIAIILLTVLIKILFWPLTHKSYKSMKEMQKLQPLMAKIREKYKNNKEQMNKELMGLYKTYKVNPMGGCLPMVIQIPVFFALYRILGSSIELRHAPFFLWINDLSAPDRLFHFSFSIPFMSPPYGIPVLTLFMGASMFIQQKMSPTAGDPTQAKVMMLLPLVFTVMFINFPSGLVLYWLVNNILSIGQQYRIIKRSA
jgi:YidC/Oxa1 family membrane protein insertase